MLRLRNALNDMGFDAEDADIEWAYSQISAENCCGWLSLTSWNFDADAARAVIKRLGPNVPDQEREHKAL